MLKKLIISIVNIALYILCVLFCMSSIFVIISYTPIEEFAFNNSLMLVVVFFTVIIVSIILGHRLNRLFHILRHPMAEWR